MMASNITRRKFLLTTGGAFVASGFIGSLGPACGLLPEYEDDKDLLSLPGGINTKTYNPVSSGIVVEAQPQVDKLFDGINSGQLLSGNYILSKAYLCKDGYISLSLQDLTGCITKVATFRRSSLINGVATTQKFELYIMNNGLGNTITNPDLLNALSDITRVIQMTERASSLDRKMTTWRRFNRL